jgi:carbon storage regulator
MLIITRKPGEGFWIDDRTEIVVVGWQGNSVKLGVRAPREVLVLRSELKLVQEQNRAATQCSEKSIDDLAARMRKL